MRSSSRFFMRTILASVFFLFVGQPLILAQTSNQPLVARLASEDQKQLVSDVTRLGDPVRGAMAFYQPVLNCAKCHELNEGGRRLGPNLNEKRAVTIEHLIESLLQPSAQIKEGFETVIAQHVDGKLLTGVLVEKAEQHLVIDQIEQPEKPLKIAFGDIDDWKMSRESTMPAGLVNQIQDRNTFLDLVSYLKSIADGGPERSAELKPADSFFAIPPLPDYEANIDHAGLIRELGRGGFSRGQEIYRLRCASCHGSKTEEGSMPTSMRFRSGKFKNGSDPLSMYKTLTHGYGMMIPQRWMTPQQKYEVIHYIREHFLKPDNPEQYFKVDDEYLDGLPVGDTRGPKPVESKPWTRMDYGPSLINTIEVSNDKTNIAQKGIVVRLDEGPGGVESGSHFLMYDQDTMRVAAVWTGGFIDYNGIHFNGVHGRHPRIAGDTVFSNRVGPGWANPNDGSFDDNRLIGRDDNRYGPLDRKWAHYKGMYRFGKQTILKYTVGETEVLETPRLRYVNERPVISRVLNIGPRQRPMVLQLAQVPDSESVEDMNPASMILKPRRTNSAGSDDEESAVNEIKLNGSSFAQMKEGKRFDLDNKDFTIAARIKTKKDGTIFAKTLDQTEWIPGGKSFFIRDGRLVFDIGWVGAVTSRRKVNDGKWHDVAITWEAKTDQFRFFVDGEAAGKGSMESEHELPEGVIRIGFTNENFPQESFFKGSLTDVRFFQKKLDIGQLKELDKAKPIANWNARQTGHILDVGPNQMHAHFSSHPVSDPASGIWAHVSSANSATLTQIEDNLRLKIAAGNEPLQLEINMGGFSDLENAKKVLAQLNPSPPSTLNLANLIQGGPANYPEILSTEVVRGDESPFAVDVFTRPKNNPWNCRLRMTGVDFSADGTEAVVSCWDGSVWKVSGLLDEKEIRWQRIAAGLFQPLGIKWIGEEIYVSCRDQIAILHDLNGDGEADWYENFNNDHQVTPHFHEFAMGLQTDKEGNFYYAKSARHALTALVPHHGTLLKVSKDGSTTEIVANGFRAANGVCINPDGTFVVTDQEGHWNPKNRINWVKPGGFYGNMFGYHDVIDESDDAMDPPLCWITNTFDRSPAELMWVESEAWGPLNGSLLNFSYGYGKIFVCPFEEVDGQKQGGMCEFPLDQFPTGIMRGRFNKADGQLYCCGMFAWSGSQEQPGGFYRVRYTKEPVHLPIKLSATESGLLIGFSGKLDPRSVANAKNFSVQVWDLKRTQNYGSAHLNEKRLQINSAELLKDGKTVRLTIPDIKPTWGMEIRYNLKTSDGKRLRNKIHNTIHQLGEK